MRGWKTGSCASQADQLETMEHDSSPFGGRDGPRVMVCFGTRPEVIKLAPVIAELRRHGGVQTITVATGQHREMLDQMLATFDLEPDVDLGLDARAAAVAGPDRRRDRGARAHDRLRAPRCRDRPGRHDDHVLRRAGRVLRGVPVGHVEAGLRTDDVRLPFPEEINRRLVSVLARWHWCPTARNAEALRAEGVDPRRLAVTGNTVIDALLEIARRPLPPSRAVALPPKRAARRILVTLHRRESQGEAQHALCRMLAGISRRGDVEILFPVHLSPVVRDAVFAELAGCEHVHLMDPLDYHSFVHLLRSSDFVVTDSGGVQEEAPVFGIPVLVMRDTTERSEGVDAGVVRLSGTDPDAVRADIVELLDDAESYDAMARAANPYGDGNAAARIVSALTRDLGLPPSSASPREARAATP